MVHLESHVLAAVIKVPQYQMSLKEMAQIQQKDVRLCHNDSLFKKWLFCVD